MTAPRPVLETFPNPTPGRGYEIVHTHAEFTSLCPLTGHPDFATIVVRYVPAAVCVELKSLKLYLHGYRQQGVFFEALVTRILSHDRYQRARALGAAIRLGCDLSGRSPDLLGHSRLELKTNTVLLQAEEPWAAMLLGEQTAKRGATLAGLLDRELKLRAVTAATRRKPVAAA